MNSITFDSPIGMLTLIGTNSALTSICFNGAGNSFNPCPLLLRTVTQLREYFAGTRKEFDIPLAPEGTDFQKKVWEELQNIPYGQTRSYGDVAKAVGSPRAARAVGTANNRNPIPILIPCHRVIGADGDMTGYGGGLDKKEFLLKLEQEHK